MRETSFKPVSGEVLNQSLVLETSKVANEEERKVSSSSESLFESRVGFIDAVKMTGKNKGTISKDTHSGKLPFEVSETGQKLYKVADLYSLYGFQNPEEAKFKTGLKPRETQKETTSEMVETAILHERLRSQEVLLSLKDAQIRDLQTSRDKLLEQNNRLTLLLPAPISPQSQQTATVETSSETIKTPWWKSFFK
jgi:hypothetical protein